MAKKESTRRNVLKAQILPVKNSKPKADSEPLSSPVCYATSDEIRQEFKDFEIECQGAPTAAQASNPDTKKS